VEHLTFSADGRFLAATSGNKSGLRVYKTADWGQVAADTDYGSGSYGADFDGRGRLVTSSGDGFIRLYDSDFKQRLETGLISIHPFMPTFRFSTEEAEEVLSYMRSIQERPKPPH